MKTKTIKLLEESIGKHLHNLGQRFLRSQNALATKLKINRLHQNYNLLIKRPLIGKPLIGRKCLQNMYLVKD